MTAAHQRYPLTWPASRKRSTSRIRGRFYGHTSTPNGQGGTMRRKRDVTITEATARVYDELRVLGAMNVILSTNVVLTRDGFPRAGQREPGDPGAAVYFDWSGKPYVFACDTYDRVADNVAALAAHVDAIRTSHRHGVAELHQAFEGYLALPPARALGRWSSWRDAFFVDARVPDSVGHDVAIALVEQRYREMIKTMRQTNPAGDHPDEAELNAHREQARKECGA